MESEPNSGIILSLARAMQENINRLERLDIVAKAIIARNALHRELSWLLFMAALCTLLGSFSAASRAETLAVRTAAGVCIVLVVMFLFEWRYSFHAFMLACFGAAIIDFWFYSQLQANSHWIGRALSSSMFIFMGLSAWSWAVPFATARKKGWQEERRTAQRLYEMLLGGPGPEDCWISAGNFWVGYFTYRLVRLEDYWAVARFKREKYHKMLEFRVLGKDGVRVTDPAWDKLELYIAGKKIRNAQVGPEGYEKLMRLTVRSSPT